MTLMICVTVVRKNENKINTKIITVFMHLFDVPFCTMLIKKLTVSCNISDIKSDEVQFCYL